MPALTQCIKKHYVGGVCCGLTVLGLILMLCAPMTNAKAVEDVKIGVIYPLSGSVASIGETCKQGVEFAVKEINQKGGIQALGGAKLKVVWGDTQSKSDIGVSETQRQINQGKVDILLGSYQSSVTMPESRVAEQAGIPFVSPISVADKITERGFKWIFRMNVKGSWIGRDFIKAAQDLAKQTNTPVTKVAVLYVNNSYGQSTAKGFKKFLGTLAPEWKLVSEISYPKDTSNLDSEISRIKNAAPDFLFSVGYVTDGLIIARTMEKFKFNPKAYFISGSASDPSYVENLKNKAKYFFEAGAWNPQLVDSGVADQFKKQMGKDISYYSSYTYTAVNLIARALEIAGSKDPQAFRSALLKNTFDGPWNATTAHPIQFDESGQNINASRVTGQFFEVEGRVKAVPVWPKAVKRGDAVLPAPDFEHR